MFQKVGIERTCDMVKNKLCIKNISGKKKIIIEQDLYTQRLLFNIVEGLKNGANNELALK